MSLAQWRRDRFGTIVPHLHCGAAMNHPCLRCGACCATFRVSMHWSQTEPTLGGEVPAELTVKVGTHSVAMRGTDSSTATRCVALRGDVGGCSSCAIYSVRPPVCREVMASYELGSADPQCDKARIRHGLPLLTPADWPAARLNLDSALND